VQVGNPVPSIRTGVLHSPHDPVFALTGFSIAHYFSDAGFWRHAVPHGLDQAFGPAWPLLMVLAVAGSAFALVTQSGDPWLRVLGAVAVLGAAGYVFTPYSAGGPNGDPWQFAVDARFVSPALAIGLLCLVLVSTTWPVSLRAAGIGCLALVVAASQFAAMGPFRAWSRSTTGVGVAIGAVAALGVAVLASGHLIGSRLSASGRSSRDRRPRVSGAVRAWLVGRTAVLIVVVAAGGMYLQSRYLAGRYRRHASVDAVSAWAQGISNSRIGTVGVPLQYPLFGADLSNRVDYLGRIGQHGSLSPILTCPDWRSAIDAGRYRFLVLGPSKFEPAGVPEQGWMQSDPAATLILRAGSVSVYAVSPRLSPVTCPRLPTTEAAAGSAP
jgi:hypothetical protein